LAAEVDMKLRGRSGNWLPVLAFAALAGGASQVIEVVDHLARLARDERLR
jgi:hypothetical protein